MRILRAGLEEAVTEEKNWLKIDPDKIFPEKCRSEFLFRYSVMVLYFSGASIESIVREKKISKDEIFRLRNRFLSLHPDGNKCGPRALLSHERLSKSRYKLRRLHEATKTPQAGAGLFLVFLDTYPDIRAFLEKRFLTRGAKRYRLKETHRDMIQLAEQLGVKADQYPFNIATCAMRALRGYRDRLIFSNPQRALSQLGEHSAKMLIKTGTGVSNHSLLVVYPLQRVLLDGHKLDYQGVVEVPNDSGGYDLFMIERLWLLVMIDECSRVVLAYRICFCSEVNAHEILACIRKAIVPWQPRELTIPGLSYPDGAGMPSAVCDELRWSLWGELAVDGALANIAESIRLQVTTELGCTMCVGQARTPVRRAVIESERERGI